jgi:hypothetical protein
MIFPQTPEKRRKPDLGMEAQPKSVFSCSAHFFFFASMNIFGLMVDRMPGLLLARAHTSSAPPPKYYVDGKGFVSWLSWHFGPVELKSFQLVMSCSRLRFAVCRFENTIYGITFSCGVAAGCRWNPNIQGKFDLGHVSRTNLSLGLSQ